MKVLAKVDMVMFYSGKEAQPGPARTSQVAGNVLRIESVLVKHQRRGSDHDTSRGDLRLSQDRWRPTTKRMMLAGVKTGVVLTSNVLKTTVAMTNKVPRPTR